MEMIDVTTLTDDALFEVLKGEKRRNPHGFMYPVLPDSGYLVANGIEMRTKVQIMNLIAAWKELRQYTNNRYYLMYSVVWKEDDEYYGCYELVQRFDDKNSAIELAEAYGEDVIFDCNEGIEVYV